MVDKGKYNDVENLFVESTFCGEVQEDNNEENHEEWLYITYNNKDMTDFEQCEINVTVGNSQKINCGLKGW